MDRSPLGRRGTAIAAVGVLALLLVGGAVAAGALQDAREHPSGEEVLERAAQRYASAETVVGNATVVASNDSRTERATVEFALAEPDRFHVTVTRANRSVEVGSNGTVAWATVDGRTVVRDLPEGNANGFFHGHGPHGHPGMGPGAGPDGNGSGAGYGHPNDSLGDHGMAPMPGENRSGHPPNVSATVTGVETVDGQRAYVVSIEPPERVHSGEHAPREANVTVWVATDDYRVLRATATDGTRRVAVRFDDQRFDVSVHESEFDPPADRTAVTGTERYEDRDALLAATDLELPGLEDAEFVAGQRITRGGTETVAQGYRAEEGNVTLVTTTAGERFVDRLDNGTTVTVGDRNATAYAVGDGTAVVWTEDGVTTGVIGEGSVEETVAVAREL